MCFAIAQPTIADVSTNYWEWLNKVLQLTKCAILENKPLKCVVIKGENTKGKKVENSHDKICTRVSTETLQVLKPVLCNRAILSGLLRCVSQEARLMRAGASATQQKKCARDAAK